MARPEKGQMSEKIDLPVVSVLGTVLPLVACCELGRLYVTGLASDKLVGPCASGGGIAGAAR